MRRDRTLSLSTCLGFLLLTVGYTHAADRPDLSQIDRRIAKEPAYNAKQPLYGLYVFGPEAKTRVWAILDKSKPDAPDYDILYFDRNADGDLTAPEERIVGKVKEGQMTFDIGSFTDPVAKQKHTEMTLDRPQGGGIDSIVGLDIKWCDKVKIWCQNAEFATTPAKAPVLWPGADGPLTFSDQRLKLNIGEAVDVVALLGHPGHGRGSTFSAVFYNFLPREVPILATLLYRDKEGKERRAQTELRERCWSIKFHGPVRVPPDAAPGKAILRLELPKDCGYDSVATEFPVELVTKKGKWSIRGFNRQCGLGNNTFDIELKWLSLICSQEAGQEGPGPSSPQVVFPWAGPSCPAFDYEGVAFIKPGVTVPVHIQSDGKDKQLKVKSRAGL